MTDQTPAPQLSTVADQVGSGIRWALTAGFAALASWLLHDGVVTGAVVAAVPAILTMFWGVYRWRKTGHRISDIFAELLK